MLLALPASATWSIIIVNTKTGEIAVGCATCLDGFNLCANGNNIDDHLRHGVVIENTYGSIVTGNMIEECNGTAIILDRDCYGITVSANVIAHHLGGGVHLLDAWGCAVSANTFTIVHSNSVLVSSNSGRITITGNNFCNTWIGGKDKRPTGGKTPMAGDEAYAQVVDTLLEERDADAVVVGPSLDHTLYTDGTGGLSNGASLYRVQVQ